MLKRQNAARREQIERHIGAVEAEIEARIEADPELAQSFAILTSIPGVSQEFRK